MSSASKFSFSALLARFGANTAAVFAPATAVAGAISAIDLPDGGQGYGAADVENLVAQAHAEGVSEGTSAERERTAAVLGSDHAQANIGGAAFCLHSTDLSAPDIVAKLPALGTGVNASAAPIAPAPVAAAPALSSLAVSIEQTPSTPVGAPEAKTDEGGGDAAWDNYFKADAAITAGGTSRLLS